MKDSKKEMKARIRVRGQPSILSSLLIHHHHQDRVENKKRPKTSLSDFLDRKLQKTSKSVQGKEKPFLSPGGGTTVGGDANQLSNKGPDPDPDLSDIVLQQLKHNEDSIQASTTTVPKESPIQDLRKQINHFQGFHGKPSAPKGLVVLGGDPMPKHKKPPFIRKHSPLPVYNHYASGSGWWDSDMEGIDNDEVGFNQVWEGVGSATIGGLDWH